LYYTEGRAKTDAAELLTGATLTNITITGDGEGLTITAENGGIQDLSEFDTDDLSEGATNKYYSDTLVDNHLTGGDGITYASGTISADLGDGLGFAGSNNAIAIDRTTVDSWYDASGAAGDVASDLSTHEQATTGVHGVTGNIVGTSDSQTLSNKSIDGELSFGGDGSSIEDSAGSLTVYAGDHLYLTSNGGDIVLDADGTVYIGSSSAGNEAATHSYVDNAVSGLSWKQAVNLLSAGNLDISGSLTGVSVDGHPAFDGTDAGYRILLTAQTTNSENGIYLLTWDGVDLTASRAEDSDTYQELVGAAVYVMEGATYGATSWVQGNHYLSDFTGQTWTQFSGQGSVTAGTGIIVDGLEVSVDTDVIATQVYADGAVGTHSDYTTNVHGVTGNVVGTSDSQTLTNKTIDASSNTISNIDNTSLINYSIDINGYTTNLGSSVTLDTDDVAEGTNEYFTQGRARGSFSAGNAINYDNTTGIIAVDASQLSTDDIAEGEDNQYYTNARVKNVLTSATQNNIVIEEVAGELIITAENGVADSTTDDLEEGATNHYYTDTRSKTATADLLTSATLSNITITGDENGLTITAENGVAGSTTDDLTEGASNLYFTNTRVIDAVDNADITPNTVQIDTFRKEEATRTYFSSASTATVHSFGYPFGSVKYIVRVVGEVSGTVHSQVTEILATVDGNNNVAVTEFGSIHTTEPALASFTVDYDGGTSQFRLRATTANSGSEVIVAATLLSWAD
jgi:hypothetical protein